MNADTEIPIINFSHGSLKPDQRLPVTVYEHKTNPAGRIRTRRILISKTGGVEYVGENYGEHAVQANALCNHFVAVEDVNTGVVDIYPANLMAMRPYIPRSLPATSKTTTQDTYREKADALAAAFGSKRKRRAVETRHRLNVDESTLSVTAAMTLAEIKSSAFDAESPSQSATGSVIESIPPQNRNATVPQDVYRLEDIVPPQLYTYLDEMGEPLMSPTREQIVQWRSEAQYPEYVLQRLARLSADSRNRVIEVRILVYYCMLVEMLRLRYTDLKRKDPLPRVDQPLKNKLLDAFTLTSRTEHGATSRTFPQTMKDKVLAYILVLVLILEDYKYDFGVVQPDTKASTARLTTLGYALGCHVGTHKLPGSHVSSKFLELKLPLVDPSSLKKAKRART